MNEYRKFRLKKRIGEGVLSNNTSKSKYSTKLITIASLLMVIGIFSYAFFSYLGRDNKNQTLSLANGTMALRFADNDNGINATMHFGETITKKFIIENTGTLESSLSLDWFNLVNTYLNRSLSYNLTYSESEDGEYKELVPETNMPTSNVPITQSISSEISVPAGETYYFNLNVTLNNLPDVEQSSDLKANFSTSFSVAEPSKYRYYTLRVDPSGGTWNTFTAPQEYQLKNNETMTIPEPTKAGYIFDGWTIQGVSSELTGTVFNMGITDTYLTANWTPVKVNVIIDGTTHEVEFGKPFDLGEPPEKEGHTFTGWNVTGPGTVEGNILTVTGTEDITVTPTYTLNNYKYIVYHSQMNIDGNGYTLVSADTDEGEAAYNTAVNPPVKTYTGFTSPTVQPLTIQIETDYPPVKNKVEYNYIRNKYNLTKTIDDVSTTEEMYYGATKDLGVPEKTGYDFTNWSVTGGTLSGNNFTLTSEGGTATANFTPKTFSVTFNANGGTVTTASKTVTYDSTYGDLPEPTYEGYKFLGWFTELENGTQVTNDATVKITANQTLFAHWEEASPSKQILTKLKISVREGTPNFLETAPAIKSYIDQFNNSENTNNMTNFYQENYYTYSTTYTFNSSTGKYTLDNPKECVWSKCYSNLANKYILSPFGSISSGTETSSNVDTIYKVTSNTTKDKLYYKSSNGKMPESYDYSEDGVYSMIDDYGTSYYYRGAVENNYIKYGKNKNGQEMWWRIIRINGDGSLRIIYDGIRGWGNGVANDSRYAITNQPWNKNNADAKYVGWMFGGAQGAASTSKAQAQTNETNSDAKTAVDTWYKENIVDTGYSGNVIDRIFCNDRSTPGVDATEYLYDSGLGYGNNITAYGAVARLGANGYGPSSKLPKPKFTCENKNDAFTVKETATTNGNLMYPVGLITADEIVAAGGKFGVINNQYYLYKSNGEYNEFSMSPLSYNAFKVSLVFGISGTPSQLYLIGSQHEKGALNPVINISREYVSTLTGDGTIENPFQT